MSTPIRLLVLVLGMTLAACRDEPPAPDVIALPTADAPVAAELPVEIQTVELGSLPMVIEASGSVRARRVSGVGAEVTGRLLEVFVDVGDRVEKGGPLFRIDPQPYRVALEEARAGLSLARAERDNALQEKGRVDKLVEMNVVSEQRGDHQRTAAAVAVARVAQMEARVSRAKTNLERTLVAAPYTGSVVERRAHEGEMAGPEPVIVLQESNALVLVLNIPESAATPVRVGSGVRLFVEGLAGTLESQVDRVSERVDVETRTYEVRAPVHDPSGTVKAGSYARAEILPAPGPPRPLVDRSAVVMREGRTYVFRVEDRTARQVNVRVGAMDAARVEILSGLEEGNRVVRGEAVGRLVDGEALGRLVDGDAVPAAAGAESASQTGPSP
jgi:RND family efflux transporter MFP subunit